MRIFTARHRAALLSKVSVAAIACCVVAFSATPASAETSVDTADPSAVAALVAGATPDGAQPVDASATGIAFETFTPDATTTIPVDPAQPIEVTADVAGREISANITLPNGLDLAAAEATADGTVVYPSESDASVAVQTLESGDTRVQTVIPDRDATHEAAFGMEGFRAVIDSAGNAGFVQNGSEGAFVPVDAPWATDATGASVPTHYEVRGDRLVQIVTPTASTAYPVVADPTWGWRNAAWGLTLSRSETASIKDYAAAASFCAALARNQRLTLACGLWSGYLQVQAATANRLRPKGCLHIVVAPLPGAISHTYC
ncbi:hypothetical protein MTES_1533 [Microbacterium testaceum StLB037]|uniref:Uncharacterized protein n=1 Tax=Microbacterium testaceum (strain StLB037) TaxID=979556 RepID=E8N961_MICTS|nr:hypothetical protein [Microbacterium testaceum]BAJ74497.1 hypothetical protein MTES_1533 [Microbacterium testaceum StLB037]